MPTDKSSNPSTRSSWNYTQTDVDTLREQIEQNEAGKRRWLLLLLLVSVAALIGALVLLSTSYALYSSAESEKSSLASENASLKALVGKCEKELNGYIEKEKRQTEALAKAQESVGRMLPGALGGANISGFARMVYESPSSRVEIDRLPPSNLFRNWKAQNEAGGTDVYTLVGGNVKGKWVIYSNLISRQ
jgi:cell division protein FtsB